MDPKKQTEAWQSRLSRSVNSALCFALAYILFSYMYWLVTALAGRACRFDSFVYYYGIKFILNSHMWDKGKATLVYVAGPLFSLALGLFSYFLYKLFKGVRTTFNIFLLWCFVIGVSIFTGQALVATLGIGNYTSPLYNGFAVVYAWWGLPAFLVYLLNVPFFLLALYFAVGSIKPFLLFASSYRKVNSQSRRRKYFFEIALAPFILGVFIVVAATFPKSSAGKNVFMLLLSMHAVYLFAIGSTLAAAWFALSYVDLLKPEVLRYKTLESPSIFFFVMLLIATAYIYITYHGIYIS